MSERSLLRSIVADRHRFAGRTPVRETILRRWKITGRHRSADAATHRALYRSSLPAPGA